MATQASIDAVQKLFIAFYQRPADVTGLEYWANRVDAAGGDTSAVVNAFATSAEATTLYPATLSTTQLVNNVYQALFGRAPDAAGLNFYANAIAAGTMTPGKLAQNILDGATGTDATIVANKLTVAKAYTAAMDTTAEILAYNGNNGNNALQNAKALLTNVNALDTSVTNATNQIPAIMVNNVNNAAATITAPGTAFTFTASPLDSATNVGLATGAAADIQVGDNVTGTTGKTDKLTLTTASTTLNLAAGGLTATGFEQLVLANGTNTITLNQAIAAAAAANSYNVITGGTGYDTIVTTAAAQFVNLTTVTGIEQFDTGAQNITFSGAAVNGVYVNGTGAVLGMGDFTNTITVASGIAGVTGGAGTDTVTIVGAGAAGLTISGVETVVGSSGADTVIMGANGTVSLSGVETVTGGAFTNSVNFTGATGATYTHAALGLKDTVSFNATNAVKDTFNFSSTVASTDKVTINGFAVGNDVINVSAALTTAGTAAAAAAAIQAVNTQPTAAVTFNTAASDVLGLNFANAASLAGDDTGGTLLANLGGTLSVSTTTDKGYIVAYQGSNAYVYYVSEGVDGDALVAATDIALIGVVNGVAVGGLTGAQMVMVA